MNPATGSADTADNWATAGHDLDDLDDLIRVAPRSIVPDDFRPCDSAKIDWMEY